MVVRLLLTGFLIVSVLCSAIAQQPQSSPPPQKSATTQQQTPPEVDAQDVVRITTNLVQIDAVVTRDGKHVTDLKPEEFELFEDGHPQAITNFSYISNVPTESSTNVSKPSPSNYKDKTAPPVLPAVARPQDVRRTVALVVDDLGMSFQSVSLARSQARKFINEQLQPNDLVAIIHTSGEVGALQQFTADRRMIYNAIDRLRWYPCSRAGVHVFAPVGTPTAGVDAPCGGARNIRSTLQALKFIVEGMRDLPGRKSLVLLSDQLPIETQEPATNVLTPGDGDLSDVRTDYTGQLKKVAELAIRSSVVIYAVDTRGLAYTGLTAADNFRAIDLKEMSSRVSARDLTDRMNSTMSARSMSMITGREGADLIARQTGGFLVRNSNDFKLKEIADDQKGYYLLAYRPTDETFNRKFHHIKVTVKRRGLTVRTRTGFFGLDAPKLDASELTANDQMKRALMSPFGASAITVRLTNMFTNFDSGSLLRSLLYISAQDLVFVDEPDGFHTATFDLGIILFGDNGRVNDLQSRAVTLRLRDDAYQSALRNGIVYSLDTPLKQAGALQFRIAIRDQKSSRIGSAGQFVQIPNLSDGRLALSGIVVTKEADKSGRGTPAPPDTQDAISSGPAVRQFRAGNSIIFAYSIYNAQLDPATRLPQLTTQTRIFRDGKAVYTGSPTPVEVDSQSDL
ncbi:MAG TPA: VWA domain-containing protein, partial [Pyrinomonadaceae bacterium]|nr:VWA domain-containing protein [Pyrinomonadaceae bacterium]